MRNSRAGALVAVGILLASLSACSTDEPELPVTTPEATQADAQPAEPEAEASPEASEEAEPEPEPEETKGGRENPLKPGEARKLSEVSAYTVSAGPTKAYGDWVEAEFTVDVDWAAIEEQGLEPGEPVTPFWDLDIKFVDAEGTTYADYPENIPFERDVSDYALSASEVYPPTASAKGTMYVAVPEDKVKGGVWVVSNMVSDRLFISPE